MEDPPQQCIEWIYNLFGECATTQQHAWSIILGYASIFAWLNAQIPQIIENFKLGSAESLSLQFLINWLLGDLSNLLGCYLTHQLPFQKYLAIYFCVADIILFGQYIYYSRQLRQKTLPDILIATLPELSDPSAPEIATEATVGPKRSRPATITGASLRGAPVTSGYYLADGDDDLEQGTGDNETASPLLQRTRPRRATTTEEIAHRRSTSIVLFGLLFLTLRSTIPTTSMNQQQASSGAGLMLTMAGRVLKRQDNGGVDTDEPPGTTPPMDPAVHLGRIFAWVCTIFYLSSRMPQLWKNYERKSVQGLSILMFFWAAMGNFTYTLSILNSPGAVDPETSKKFLKEAVPYILGSSGTLLFDVSIFIQWLYYSKLRRGGGHHHHHHRHHHQHGHRRRRSSRHQPRQSRTQSRPETVCMSNASSQLGAPGPGGYSMLVDQEEDEYSHAPNGNSEVGIKDP